MRKRTMLALAGLAAAVGVAGSPPASAQSGRSSAARPAQPAPAAPTPDRTTSSYGDWILRCQVQQGAEGSQPSRSCELAQAVADARQQPVAQILIGRPQQGAPTLIAVQLPVNVSLSASPRLVVEEGQDPLELSYSVCVPRGCLAQAELREDVLRRLKGRDEDRMRIEFRNAAGAAVVIPVSMRGLTGALEALAREGR